MKRLFLILLLLITSPVFAKNVKSGSTIGFFQPKTLPDVWSVKIVEGFTTKGGYPVYSGSVIKGRIENVKDPKRLKKEC